MESLRTVFISGAILLVAFAFGVKLYYIQVLTKSYEGEAEKNIVQRIREQPQRGMIFDRNGQLIVANENVYDILVVPKKFQLKDTLQFCQIFGISPAELKENLKKAKEFSPFKPSPFIKQLDVVDFAKVQEHLSNYAGLSYKVRTVRRYVEPILANVLGYVKEIDKNTLEYRKNRGEDYEKGDLIGKAGIEASYEKILRGIPGSRYVVLNVKRIEKGSFRDGQFDTLTRTGNSLQTGIDLDLQRYGEQLMAGKIGSIVAIEPATGQILAMVSFPSYDPNTLTGRGKDVTNNYAKLISNRYTPLFNRAVMAMYPPGSTIKTVQALIGLQMGAIDSTTHFSCVQSIVKCHGHPYNLGVKQSIQYSCNPFYCNVFRKIILHNGQDNPETASKGVKIWREYMLRFGLGKTLDTDLYGEKTGLIPTPEYYDRKYGKSNWYLSNIYSLGIGQGEMMITPLHMANVAAILANRGFYYKPHIVRAIDGDTAKIHPRFLEKQHTGIDKIWFDMIVDGMENVVKAGTARRASIKDVVVCGKTGTAQNPHGEDHSVFIAFAPKENPKIAISVYVENAGFGGTWAAPIASLMIEKYLKKNQTKEEKEKEKPNPSRKHLEEQILKKSFMPKEEIKLAKLDSSQIKLTTLKENKDTNTNKEKGKKPSKPKNSTDSTKTSPLVMLPRDTKLEE